MIHLALLFYLVKPVLSDFECLCNYNIELPVYTHHSSNSSEIGKLYEFDCKPTSSVLTGEATYKAIQFEQQLGYVHLNENIQIQICAGDPSPLDTVTTVAATPTTHTAAFTTKDPTTVPTSTIMSSTTASTRTSTTSTYLTKIASLTMVAHTQPTLALTTSSNIPQGHIKLCPDHVKTDASLKGGFIWQYGEFCYEFVNWKRAFDGAESHCRVESGTLASISNQQEQDLLEHFLIGHNVSELTWIGLNDKQSEGVLTWTSGVPVTYTNFQTGFKLHSNQTHTYNDCFAIENGGGWIDQPCGLAISIINLGENHPFICQYNISAKIRTFFDILPDAISVG